MKSAAGVRAGLIAGVSMIGLLSVPSFAQSTAQTGRAAADTGIEEIVVTAQRTSQSLPDMPIAVATFSAEALQRQQIRNSLDLQLTLPAITFTKANLTGSNFTICGICGSVRGNRPKASVLT